MDLQETWSRAGLCDGESLMELQVEEVQVEELQVEEVQVEELQVEELQVEELQVMEPAESRCLKNVKM